MHDFVLKIFSFVKSFLHFMKIVFLFCILMLLFHWVEHLTNANWDWLSFIRPFLDGLLVVANKIYSVEFNFFGAVFEFKYFSALVILALMIVCMNLLTMLTNVLEGAYRSAHFVCKKTEEIIFNKSLKDSHEKEEKRIKKYSILINTQLKKKYAHEELNVNIDEQNKLMNEFISKQTGCKPSIFCGGYLYSFSNFDNIDTVLDTMFKVVNSNAPIACSICVQINDDMVLLKKLADLKHFGKITMLAETVYRYKFNETHRYQTSIIGVFQSEDKTIEVHEFKEIL